MSLDTTSPRSRRALLGAAVGAAVATVASAIGRPAPVRAGIDGDVVLGASNTASKTTTVHNITSTAGVDIDAIVGRSARGVGVRGEGGYGGIWGSTTEGESTAVWGYASSLTGETYGLGAEVFSPDGIGTMSWHVGNGTAIAGYTGTSDTTVTPRPNTAILGIASQDVSTARGVVGVTTAGQAIRGEATSGTGVYATATTGTALNVVGKARFSRSGRATVSAGRSYVDVDLTKTGGLGGSPLILATRQTYRSGVYVGAARKNYPSSGKFRIYLTRTVTRTTYVAWLVVG